MRRQTSGGKQGKQVPASKGAEEATVLAMLKQMKAMTGKPSLNPGLIATCDPNVPGKAEMSQPVLQSLAYVFRKVYRKIYDSIHIDTEGDFWPPTDPGRPPLTPDTSRLPNRLGPPFECREALPHRGGVAAFGRAAAAARACHSPPDAPVLCGLLGALLPALLTEPSSAPHCRQ